MPSADALRAIRRATSRRHGVATGDSLELTQRQVDRCCEAGILQRRHPGVYVDPAHPWSPLQDLACAVAAGGYLAAAWGRSAAALWELRRDHPATPEIVVPRRRVAKVDGVTVHRSSDLCWAHVLERQGIRVTNPLVTVLDLGVVLDQVGVAEAIIAGRRRKLFDVRAIEATVARLARPGRTGIRTVRAALGLVMVGTRPLDSELELHFSLLASRYGLPAYVYQQHVRRNGRDYYIDFAYPEVKLAIEVDGYEQRDTAASLYRDDRRQNQLALDGWLVLRFTADRIRFDAANVAKEILEALGSRGYRFGR